MALKAVQYRQPPQEGFQPEYFPFEASNSLVATSGKDIQCFGSPQLSVLYFQNLL